jgi:formylglycine-generating enzyme required for sulfatase activity
MLAGRVSLRLLLVAASVAQGAAASAVTIDWVTVGDPGNAADDTGFGSVAQVYRIAETEVTNAQYAEFLDAVAATDTNGLYNASMSSSAHGGITQSGSPGSFDYGVKPGFAPKPVNFVSFYDSLRFANWLHNGQLAGAQDATTTEDGAYTITAQGVADNTITRNAGASIFLTSEDEWYKAAYYDAPGASYFDYPAGSDTQTTCASPTAVPNHANCGSIELDLTDVGDYTGSASPYGTFDQGGNILEWTEAIIGSNRGLRGGGFGSPAIGLAASIRGGGSPSTEVESVGFRVPSLPEPGRDLVVMLSMLGLACLHRRHV